MIIFLHDIFVALDGFRVDRQSREIYSVLDIRARYLYGLLGNNTQERQP